MSPQDAVLAANAAFYEAFAKQDLCAMDEVWAQDAPVACLHPGWRPLVGRPEVMTSWAVILNGGNAPPVRYAAATAHVMGGFAYVLCTEDLPQGKLVATNVFILEGSAWKMVHHHASPMVTRPNPNPPPPPPPPRRRMVH
ncbi:MAG: nuclear transport factor 2 family protein [Myxococcota bacterium]